MGDVFAVNVGFKSKLRRVTVALGGSSRAATSTERAETDQKINEDRKLAIQAWSVLFLSVRVLLTPTNSIVRVMKARKQATHAQLVNEVTRLLAQRFQPKPATIKKQIESLIERDYLERSATERKTLLYIA